MCQFKAYWFSQAGLKELNTGSGSEKDICCLETCVSSRQNITTLLLISLLDTIHQGRPNKIQTETISRLWDYSDLKHILHFLKKQCNMTPLYKLIGLFTGGLYTRKQSCIRFVVVAYRKRSLGKVYTQKQVLIGSWEGLCTDWGRLDFGWVYERS